MCAGTTAPLTYSPSYAPPEVALAMEAGIRTITARPAVDLWALGIMAFEMLTHKAVFPPLVTTKEAIWAQLTGRGRLPWEQGAPRPAESAKKLRGLRRPILQCLQRNPDDRPTAEEVLAHLRNLFDSHSSAP